MTVSINDLEITAIIGILEHERKNPQRILVDCVFEYDFDGEFVDYSHIRSMIITIVTEGKFLLLEECIAALQNEIAARFKSIKKLTLAIKKPDIFSDCIVSVQDQKVF